MPSTVLETCSSHHWWKVYMPSVATQSAFKDMLASASPGSPRNPISEPNWQYHQPPSWLPRVRTRRSGMRRKPYPWRMKHSVTQTEGGMYNAAAWDIITETSDAYPVDATVVPPFEKCCRTSGTQ